MKVQITTYNSLLTGSKRDWEWSTRGFCIWATCVARAWFTRSWVQRGISLVNSAALWLPHGSGTSASFLYNASGMHASVSVRVCFCACVCMYTGDHASRIFFGKYIPEIVIWAIILHLSPAIKFNFIYVCIHPCMRLCLCVCVYAHVHVSACVCT